MEPRGERQNLDMDRGTPLHIRPASLDDATAICAVHVASVRGLARRAYTPEQIRAWAENRAPEQYRWAMDHDEEFLVAERDGRVVGFASLLGGEVRSLYVHPGEAGRGTGTALLERVEELASAHGYTTIRLHASLNALRFYQARGWREGTHVALRLPDGQPLPAVRMDKEIDAPPRAARNSPS